MFLLVEQLSMIDAFTFAGSAQHHLQAEAARDQMRSARAEAAAMARGLDRITLHACVTARGFFERLGYIAVSRFFAEVTIPYVKMEKVLFN
jgi:predicted GNAT family N-acyltransferase